MLCWCPTREFCEVRGQEEGWTININKTLGQLSPRSSSSTGFMQEVEIQLLPLLLLFSFFFSFEEEHLALDLKVHKRPSKRRQKSITLLASNSPT